MADPSLTARALRSLSPEMSLYALFLLANVSALLLGFVPRSVAPGQPPSLRLSEPEVRAQIAADRQAAKGASNEPFALEVDAVFLKHGEAEQELVDELGRYKKRLEVLADGHGRLLETIGADGIVAQRARAVERFEAAIALRLPEEQVRGVMGSLPLQLAKAHMTRDGEITAPHFVLRTMYKARWNVLHGRKPEEHMSAIEQRAYGGWLGLHADAAPSVKRLEALEAYASSDPGDAAEATGVVLFKVGRFEEAALAFEQVHAERSNLRARNWAKLSRVMAKRMRDRAPTPP